MTDIKASDVKELREMTNIGMMECKKALTEAKGDKKRALTILKEKGMAIAAKRAGRSTNEGCVFGYLSADKRQGFLLQICCETDFVARNANFLSIVDDIGKKFVEGGKAFLKSNELINLLNEGSSKTGEKIIAGDHAILILEETNGLITSYIHSNKKIGVLLAIETDASDNVQVQEYAKDISMQIAAMNPITLTSDDVSDEIKNEQKEIFLKQMADNKQNDDIKEKIVAGKLKKYFSDLCLMEMKFVKDSKLKVNDLQIKIEKENQLKCKITGYKRLEI